MARDPHKVNAGAYNSVVERAVLGSIRLTECRFDMKPEAIELDPSTWRKDIRGDVAQVFVDTENGRLAGIFLFEVIFRYRRKRVLTVSAKYLVIYKVVGDIESEIGELFVERVGRVVTYPYFRSVVATLTAQAGIQIPPLPIISLAPRTVKSAADLEEQGPVKILTEIRKKDS
jgi:preprotein translocase subunit SecB